MLRYYVDNREHLMRWSPLVPPDFYTLSFWQKGLARNVREYTEDRSARFVIGWHDRDPGRIIGTCGLTGIERGPVQSCLLGYGLDKDVEGQGVMTEALRALIDFAFHTLGLHRIQATYSPLNQRSGAVLRRLGFTVEGYARDYLFVNGDWQDHILAALVNPSPAPPPL